MSIEGKGLRGMTFLAFVSLTVFLTGCSMTGSKSFTLKTNLPANFNITADVYYSPATGATCVMPPTTSSYIPGRKRLKSEMQDIEHSVEFEIPLSHSAGGCPLVLRSVRLDIQGKWGPDADDVSNDVAALSFVDQPNKTNSIYNGECQWLFRTIGPRHHIIKLLKCRAVDDKGNLTKQLAGGILERDLLERRTISFRLAIAKNELPAIDDNWIEFPAGWKRCLGKDIGDRYAFCNGNEKDFKSFIMPDGRDCNIYPSCTE